MTVHSLDGKETEGNVVGLSSGCSFKSLGETSQDQLNQNLRVEHP